MAELTAPFGAVERSGRVRDVLRPADVERYRAIFALQEEGDWPAADRLIDQIENRILMGHVVKQRLLHPTAYRATYEELADWLESYADLPGAWRIHSLAVKRRPKGAAGPRKPDDGYLRGSGEFGIAAARVSPRRDLSGEQRDAVARGKAEIESLVAAGKAAEARAALSRSEMRDWTSDAEFDQLRVVVARAFFAAGDNAEAARIAERAAQRSGDRVPESLWIAGLAAWRSGDYETASRHFLALAGAAPGTVEDDLIAGGAYWAARTAGALGEPLATSRMLRLAAGHPRSIYGLLALRSMLDQPRFDWSPPPLSDGAVALLARSPALRRAVALGQVGRPADAEDELRKLYPRLDGDTAAALLPVAEKLSLPALEIRLGSQLAFYKGTRHDRALYPLPDWTPREGFQVDRALLFALVRQESVFDSSAKSPAGARGLMQLMPRTASFMDGSRRYVGENADDLYLPELNLDLGQRYVRHLLESDIVGGNLVLLLAAYNAGPGRLAEWLAKIDVSDDPLLFVESLPITETRRFVRRVLSNMWIYRSRLDQPTVTLDQMVAGRWPVYRDLDGSPEQLTSVAYRR